MARTFFDWDRLDVQEEQLLNRPMTVSVHLALSGEIVCSMDVSRSDLEDAVAAGDFHLFEEELRNICLRSPFHKGINFLWDEVADKTFRSGETLEVQAKVEKDHEAMLKMAILLYRRIYPAPHQNDHTYRFLSASQNGPWLNKFTTAQIAEVLAWGEARPHLRPSDIQEIWDNFLHVSPLFPDEFDEDFYQTQTRRSQVLNWFSDKLLSVIKDKTQNPYLAELDYFPEGAKTGRDPQKMYVVALKDKVDDVKGMMYGNRGRRRGLPPWGISIEEDIAVCNWILENPDVDVTNMKKFFDMKGLVMFGKDPSVYHRGLKITDQERKAIFEQLVADVRSGDFEWLD